MATPVSEELNFHEREINDLINLAYDEGMFFDKSPLELVDGDIDENMRPIINKINKSGWLITIFCCEGHDELSSAYICFLFKKEDLSRFLLKLFEASKQEDFLVSYEIDRSYEDSDKIFKVAVHVSYEPFFDICPNSTKKEALAFFTNFGDLVNE